MDIDIFLPMIPSINIQKYDEEFITLDNGGEPFKVCVKDGCFWVFMVDDLDYDPEDSKNIYNTLVVKPTSYLQMFIGKSTIPEEGYSNYMAECGPEYDGHAILFKLTENSYMFVGEKIFEFKVPNGEVIEDFIALYGNSRVIYPYAIGKNNIYLFLEGVLIPRKLNDPDLHLSPYDCYYDKETKGVKKQKYKIIRDRLW